jgi:CheY-like chemotaxis protein
MVMENGKSVNEKLVLVVDDDLFAREYLSKLLNVEGYSVLEAEDGQKALEVLEQTIHAPCMILLDLAMPVMDGHEFLKIRAKDPALRQIPVAVVSGNVQRGEPLTGVHAYLEKPVSRNRLIAAVEHRC